MNCAVGKTDADRKSTLLQFHNRVYHRSRTCIGRITCVNASAFKSHTRKRNVNNNKSRVCAFHEGLSSINEKPLYYEHCAIASSRFYDYYNPIAYTCVNIHLHSYTSTQIRTNLLNYILLSFLSFIHSFLPSFLPSSSLNLFFRSLLHSFLPSFLSSVLACLL